MRSKTLEEYLRVRTRPACSGIVLSGGRRENSMSCLCHHCLIAEGRSGICKVRFNQEGVLRVPWGYTTGIACDPIEKKPFFHVFPGSNALSFGMLGCDLHCSYCQNWLTSQALRDDSAGVQPRDTTPKEIVSLAVRYGASTVSSTYNEPLITSEWAVDIFKLAKEKGIPGSFVSNGNASPEVIEYLEPYVQFYKVDLKSFNDKNYRKLGGTLEAVLKTIELLVRNDFWVEVVTLVVPGFNDSREELQSIAEFLVGVSPDIPWHVTGFHQNYQMIDPENTPASTLLRAVEIGQSAGLRFVYAGNRTGQVGSLENTHCPGCGATLIERYGFRIMSNQLTDEGKCPECSLSIPGRW